MTKEKKKNCHGCDKEFYVYEEPRVLCNGCLDHVEGQLAARARGDNNGV